MHRLQHTTRLCSILILNLVLIFSITSCVEEFETDSIEYERLLVVDANISDQAKPHQVRLFYTSPIDNEIQNTQDVLSGAAVWVEDNLGARTDFFEQDPGYYYSPEDFAGEAGKSYSLFITTAEGKNYKSTTEELYAAPQISRVYNKFTIELGDRTANTIPGVQFFIDVDDTSIGSKFYRYEWSDVHQVIVPYPKQYEAIPSQNGYDIVPFTLDVEECYREDNFKELILATSSSSSNNQLIEVPIKFSDVNDFNVTTRYSIEITQRSISPEAYSYYRKIELFNESNGSLFDKQQGLIVGNITSLDDPEENVLGYFEVSGASSERIYMDYTDLDPEALEYLERTCTKYGGWQFRGSVEEFYQALDLPESIRGPEIARRGNFELVDLGARNELFFAHRLCADCRRRGSLNKPSYWE
ncbi:DUF4249 domain-containing protein [Roseivirga pacifica]|uniref:DUF4249 domain-containing protein n=1 Tax=Roseivirga pacifica TaxID=1267423 RepID=UPI003BAC915A